MSWYPAYVPENTLDENEEQLLNEREKAGREYDNYLGALQADDLDRAIKAKRSYQLAAYQRRQVEGEILWVVLGHAIGDIADRVDPGDEAVTERGQQFVRWSVGTDRLQSVQSRDRLQLIVVRRSPTLPESHAVYVETMFDMSDLDIRKARERDRAMLEQAGWTRRGEVSSDPVAKLSCPACGNELVVRTSNPAGVTVQTKFVADDGITREICPHCDSDVYVKR